MTDVNGLRLAYRGLVAGLAGAYVWVAIAMALAAIVHRDPLAPLRPIALVVTASADEDALAFVLGLLLVQAAGALVGMCFAYFFARFFTIRPTLAVAAPIVALLAWALIGAALSREAQTAWLPTHAIPLLATIGYGLLMGAAVPTRGDVTRYSGSPST